MAHRIQSDDDLPDGVRTVTRDRDGAPVIVAVDRPVVLCGLPCLPGTDARLEQGIPVELSLSRDVDLALDDGTAVVALRGTRVWLSQAGVPTRFTPARTVRLDDRPFAAGHPVDVFYRGGRLAEPWFVDDIMIPAGSELRDDPDASDLIEVVLHRPIQVGRHRFEADTVLHLRRASRAGVTGRLVVWLTDLWNRASTSDPTGRGDVPRLRGVAWLAAPHLFDGELVDADRRVGLTYDERILVMGNVDAGEPAWWQAQAPDVDLPG